MDEFGDWISMIPPAPVDLSIPATLASPGFDGGSSSQLNKTFRLSVFTSASQSHALATKISTYVVVFASLVAAQHLTATEE